MRNVRHRTITLCLLLAVGATGTASGHGPEPKADREIVRLQGYRGARPDSVAIESEVVLNILGQDQQMYLTSRRTFHLDDEPGDAKLSDRFSLQGDRETLARIAAARPGQRVTILADHRPGRSDLFLLTADFCPAD